MIQWLPSPSLPSLTNHALSYYTASNCTKTSSFSSKYFACRCSNVKPSMFQGLLPSYLAWCVRGQSSDSFLPYPTQMWFVHIIPGRYQTLFWVFSRSFLTCPGPSVQLYYFNLIIQDTLLCSLHFNIYPLCPEVLWAEMGFQLFAT